MNILFIKRLKVINFLPNKKINKNNKIMSCSKGKQNLF